MLNSTLYARLQRQRPTSAPSHGRFEYLCHFAFPCHFVSKLGNKASRVPAAVARAPVKHAELKTPVVASGVPVGTVASSGACMDLLQTYL